MDLVDNIIYKNDLTRKSIERFIEHQSKITSEVISAITKILKQ